jgi:hypothetical protein
MIDLCHLLAVMASRLLWQQIKVWVSHLFALKAQNLTT